MSAIVSATRSHRTEPHIAARAATPSLTAFDATATRAGGYQRAGAGADRFTPTASRFLAPDHAPTMPER